VIRDDGSVALESELWGPNQDKLSRFGLSGSGHSQLSPVKVDYPLLLSSRLIAVKGSFGRRNRPNNQHLLLRQLFDKANRMPIPLIERMRQQAKTLVEVPQLSCNLGLGNSVATGERCFIVVIKSRT